MDLQLKEVVKDKSDEYIGNETDGYYQKISELPAYQEHEHQKEHHRKERPEDVL